MQRGIIFIIICLLLIFVTAFSASADDLMPDGYGELTQEVSEWSGDRLPEEIYSQSVDEVGEAVKEMSDGKFWLKEILAVMKERFFFSASLFIKLCGLLILASIFSALGRSLSSETMSGAVRFCTATAIFASIIYIQTEHFQKVELFFQRLVGIMSAMIPITGTVWAMGGNISTASAGTSGRSPGVRKITSSSMPSK